MENSNLEEKLRQLFDSDHWSEEDRSWVLQYLEHTDNHELRKLMEEKFREDSVPGFHQAEAERLLSLIHEKTGLIKSKHRWFPLISPKRLSLAASIILITGVSVFLYVKNQPEKDANIASIQQPGLINDVAPGRDNAILTLSDGSSIVLDSAANGVLTQEGNMKVQKIDGQVLYAANGGTGDKIMYNTLSTARGNQYQLQLADGSKVWLNAASSIRFPTAFTGNERRVEITGEVYFEVAPSISPEGGGKRRSFIVSKGEMQVEVLGTQFNINAYDDEDAIKTTLAEGKVKVTEAGSSVVLQPSQQAIVARENQKLKVQQVDLEKELAWKAGMFEFQDDDLPAIMRQLARWYDVDVNFSGAVSKKMFNGSIRRQATLSQVLEILKLVGVSWSLQGKTVTIQAN